MEEAISRHCPTLHYTIHTAYTIRKYPTLHSTRNTLHCTEHYQAALYNQTHRLSSALSAFLQQETFAAEDFNRFVLILFHAGFLVSFNHLTYFVLRWSFLFNCLWLKRHTCTLVAADGVLSSLFSRSPGPRNEREH